jgi:hypothetical protein
VSVALACAAWLELDVQPRPFPVSTAFFEYERGTRPLIQGLQRFQPSQPDFFFSILPVPLSVLALTREPFTLSQSDIAAFRTVMSEHFYLKPRSWPPKLQHDTLELTWRRLLQTHSRHFDPGGIPWSPDTSIHKLLRRSGVMRAHRQHRCLRHRSPD